MLLTGVLIVGVVVIAASLALRLAATPPATLPAPVFDPRALGAERLVLPAGEAVTALGGAGRALLVATRDAAGAERLRVYDAATGEALREIALERAEQRASVP